MSELLGLEIVVLPSPFGGRKGAAFRDRTLFFNVLSLGRSSALGNSLCEKSHEFAIAGG